MPKSAQIEHSQMEEKEEEKKVGNMIMPFPLGHQKGLRVNQLLSEFQYYWETWMLRGSLKEAALL